MTTSYSNIDVKDLNAQLDAYEVISLIGYADIPPKQSGGELRCLCPLHKEAKKKKHNGDLAISAEKRLYHCKSPKCDGSKGGDLVDLYRKSMGLSLPEAIDALSRKVKLTRPYQEIKKVAPSIEITMTAEEKESLQKLWNSALKTDPSIHPYIERKRIDGCPGLRFINCYNKKSEKKEDAILVPYKTINGDLRALLRVYPDGYNSLVKGSKQKGTFFVLGDLEESKTIHITEGFSTAHTVWLSLEKRVAVVSVGSAIGLHDCYIALQKKCPHKEIVLSLDNDEAGRAVLKNCGPNVMWNVPDKEGADYNDMYYKHKHSLASISTQLKRRNMTTTETPVPKKELSNVEASLKSVQEQKSSETKSLREWLTHYKCAVLEDVQQPVHLFTSTKDSGVLKLGSRLMQRGEATVIGGSPKAGKSLLGLNMAVSVATGGEFLGVFSPSISGSVIYISFEDDVRVIMSRLKEFNLNLSDLKKLDKNLYIHNGTSSLIAAERDGTCRLSEEGKGVKSTVKDINPSLIIVDTLSKAFSYDENCNATANKMYEESNKLFGVTRGGENNPTILFIQHLRKGNSNGAGDLSIDSIRGASAFAASCRTVLGINKEKETKTLHMLGSNCGEDFTKIEVSGNVKMDLSKRDKTNTKPENQGSCIKKTKVNGVKRV